MILRKVKDVGKVRLNLLLLTNLVTISLLVSAVYFGWNDAAQVLGAGAGSAQGSGSSSGGSVSSSGSSSVRGWADPVAAAAAAGLQRSSPQLGERSARWAPFVVPTCAEGMPRHWAPCRVGAAGEPAELVYGEEVVYPDFSIPEPIFMTEQDRQWWRSQNVWGLRGYLFEGRAYFKSQHAQTLVFKNVQFNNNPPKNWSPQGCMAPSVGHRGLAPLAGGAAPQLQRAVLANTPDGHSLQHFLDRVTKILVQSEPWRTPATVAVSSIPESALMQGMWATLMGAPDAAGDAANASSSAGAAGQQHQPQALMQFSAAELVFACRCPMVHPFFHARLAEALHLPEPAPLAQRRTVLYLSRGPGAGAIRNQERRVLNEPEVLEALKGVLAQRGKGEQLEVFDPARFTTLQELAAFFAANVSAVVGPHGGAFYNFMFFSPPDTLLVEFLPTSRFGVLVWEEASMGGRKVAVLPTPPVNASTHDMHVSASLAAAALQQHLGTAWEKPEPRLEYAWDLEQLRDKKERRRRRLNRHS